MSIVGAIQGELRTRNIRADWINTGGGCMALSVLFGENVDNDPDLRRYEILITERDDNFYGRPERVGDEVAGFLAGLYVSDDRGERAYDECVIVYHSSDKLWSPESVRESIEDSEDGKPSFGPGESAVDVQAEIVAMSDHVEFVLRIIEAAEFAHFVEGKRER